jgi:hypothetical protein
VRVFLRSLARTWAGVDTLNIGNLAVIQPGDNLNRGAEMSLEEGGECGMMLMSKGR